MRRIEVRCCCDAGKLLGTVPILDGWIGQPVIRFLLIRRTSHLPCTDVTQPIPSTLALPVRTFNVINTEGRLMESRLVLNSDGHAADLIKRIPGFISAEDR